MSKPYEQERERAVAWAGDAAEVARRYFGQVTARPKADRSPVTDADHAVQDLILERIARDFPEDAVITEETQSEPDRHPPVAADRRCWVIDPIDGTRNYSRAIPSFTIAISLMEDGRPVLGIVHEPMTRMTYWATEGGGTWLDGERLSEPPPRPGEPINISIPTTRHEGLPPVVHGWIDRMIARNLGTTALHMALLATGGLDAVYCRRSKLWDLAAGEIIARETGSILRSVTGESYWPMDLTAYRHEAMPCIAGRPEVVNELVAEYRASLWPS